MADTRDLDMLRCHMEAAFGVLSRGTEYIERGPVAVLTASAGLRREMGKAPCADQPC